ncbi:hypothetical protein WN990_26850, partial [Kitasatospora purpeofusca]
WHSVPRIRGTDQAPGAEYAARDVRVRSDEEEAVLSLDLAGAYPRSDVAGWRREARLDRRDGRVRVRDTWDLAPSTGAGTEESATRVHLVVAGTVATGEGYAVVTALEGAGAVRITWEPASAPCTTTVRLLDDPWLGDVWGERLTRIGIDVTALGPRGTLTWVVEELPGRP